MHTEGLCTPVWPQRKPPVLRLLNRNATQKIRTLVSLKLLPSASLVNCKETALLHSCFFLTAHPERRKMTDFLIGHVRQETAPTQLLSGLSDHLKSKKTYPKSTQNVNHTKFGRNTRGVMSGLDHREVRKNAKTANPSFGQQKAVSENAATIPLFFPEGPQQTEGWTELP